LLLFISKSQTCNNEGWCDLPEAIQRVDKTVGLIVEGLKRHELLDKVNIIITADHGMTKTSCNKVIDLDKYMSTQRIMISGTPVLTCCWRRKLERRRMCINALKTYVIYKNEVPEYFHVRNSQRVSPFRGLSFRGLAYQFRKGSERNNAQKWSMDKTRARL